MTLLYGRGRWFYPSSADCNFLEIHPKHISWARAAENPAGETLDDNFAVDAFLEHLIHEIFADIHWSGCCRMDPVTRVWEAIFLLQINEVTCLMIWLYIHLQHMYIDPPCRVAVTLQLSFLDGRISRKGFLELKRKMIYDLFQHRNM